MRIDGAIFDMDGTLLDSMPVWDSLGADYLRSLGVRPKEGLFEKTKTMTLRQVAVYFQAEYGLSLTEDEIERGINARIETFYRHEVQPKPGAGDFLQYLSARGVKMCVVTATDHALAEAALARCGLRFFFQRIVTCGEFGSGKDTPAIFEYALQTLGTEKTRTPVFEDSIQAVKTAKQSGFPAVAVYDKSFAENGAELRALANLYVHELPEARSFFD